MAGPAAATDARLTCPDCSYALTGLPARRCPECGRAFDPFWLAAGNRGKRHFVRPDVLPVWVAACGVIATIVAVILALVAGTGWALAFLLVAAPAAVAAPLLRELVR